MALVGGMAVTIVHIVRVVAVGNCHVSTAAAMEVIVVGVLDVTVRATFVDMISVHDVQVPIMHVVHVLLVRYGDVTTPVSVDVGMVDVLGVRHSHCCSSCA